MSLKLRYITFFVTDLEKETSYYSEILNLKAVDIRAGWSEYIVSKDFNIAFHKGKGKRPRLTFTTNEDIAQVRDDLNRKGARLSPLKDHGNGTMSCKGKDKEGLTIEIFNARQDRSR